jgi:hypothetical protein
VSVWGWFLEFGPLAIVLLAILLIAISVRVLGFVVGRGKERNVLGKLSFANPFAGILLAWASDALLAADRKLSPRPMMTVNGDGIWRISGM